MKKTLLLLALIFVVTGCSTKISPEENYEIVDVIDPYTQQAVSILTYTSKEGDFYYRVMPSSVTISMETDYFNSYPINWTKITNPTIKE